MRLEDATAYTASCFNGEPASCSFACPFMLDIRSFLEKAEKGRWSSAYKALKNAVVFPAVTAALCPAPCRSHCQRTQTGDEALRMNELEDSVIRFTKNKKPDMFVIPPKPEKIAVVGGGVSGLACAVNLSGKKFAVTVFEKAASRGGSLRGDSRFADFENDFALQFTGLDTAFEYNREITSLSELDGFDAVYIATGTDGRDFGLLDSWDNGLLSTEAPRVFLGGMLTGVPLIESLEHGIRVSTLIEVFLQTGKPSLQGEPNRQSCERYLRHDGAEPAPAIEPSTDEGYTEVEAKLEAARCFKCDCTMCTASCEMLDSFRKKPKKISIEVYTDTIVNPPISTHTLTRQAYSCNMCGRCKAVCPENVDIGALLQTSRSARFGTESHPAAFHDYWLREMDFSTEEGLYTTPPSDNADTKYLFFPGCQLGAHNPNHVLRAYTLLKEEYGAGIFVGCCGAPAYWAGDEKRTAENAERIKNVWREYGEPSFVFACATCESVFDMLLPEIKRVSLYSLLANSENITPSAEFKTAVVFDPCNARGDELMQNSVRTLAERSGTTLSELPDKNRCCGYGGHIQLANPKLFGTIVQNRSAMSELPYIVYCANCREVFVSKGKECTHILDIAFGETDSGALPRIDEKRENSLFVKRELMKDIEGRAFAAASKEWDALELTIDAELLESVDRKLIALSDIKEAVWCAERDGDYFVDGDGGERQCSLVKPVLTYWVSYKKRGDNDYEILSAYYHRMKFEGGE